MHKTCTIRVSKDHSTHGVSYSIVSAVRAGSAPVLQAVGPAAISTASKGIAAANQTLAEDSKRAVAEISFQTTAPLKSHVEAGRTQEISMLVFRLIVEELT